MIAKHKIQEPPNIFFTARMGLALLAGLCTTLSIPYSGSLTALAFFAWIPLFFSLDGVRGARLFLLGLLFSLVFNLGTMYWALFYLPMVSGSALLIFSFVMALAVYVTQTVVRMSRPYPYSYLFWVPAWVSYEYLHHRWDLSSPWLTLGNTFAVRPEWVQWFEYTGVLGGTFWIMAVNVLVFITLRVPSRHAKCALGALGSLSLSIPLAVSWALAQQLLPATGTVNTVVVQPNIDPHEEKFDLTSDIVQQLEKLLALVQQYSAVELIIGPETAISRSYFIHEGLDYRPLKFLAEKMQNYPHGYLLLGAYTGELLHAPSTTSKPFDSRLFSESYNSTLLMNSSGKCEYIHKSYLLPWAEQVPFMQLLPFLEDVAIKLGAYPTLTPEREDKVFHTPRFSIATAICFDALYGEALGRKVNLGAQMIAIISSDGWWGNSPGYQQLSAFARLRAVETRRWVARSANTGVSSIIDIFGNVVQSAPWKTATTLAYDIPLHNQQTFYSKHGDYIGRISLIMVLATLIILLARGRKSARHSSKHTL